MRKHGILWLVAIAAIFLTPAAQAEEGEACPATEGKAAVTQITYKDDHVIASGTWEVSGGASGALLQFRVDERLLQMEARTGTSGTWSIARTFKVCDRPIHALQVLVYPSVTGGEGRLLQCLEQLHRSDPAQFSSIAAPS